MLSNVAKNQTCSNKYTKNSTIIKWILLFSNIDKHGLVDTCFLYPIDVFKKYLTLRNAI